MIYIDIGRREQGKTTLAWSMVKQLPARMVFDPRGLFGGDGRCSTAPELDREFRKLESMAGSQVIYATDDDVQEGFERFSRYVRSAVKRCPTSIGVLIDEAAFVQTDTTPDLQWVLRCASRQRVHIVLTAHRPSDVSTRVRAIADYWLLFHMRQEHDLAVVRERCGDVVSALVQRLKAREFVRWDDTVGAFVVHRQPEKWYTTLGPGAPPIPVPDLIDPASFDKELDRSLPFE